MIRTVFLDMDGTLTDFVGGICGAFDKTDPYPDETRDYTFWNVWPEISTKDVNAICGQEFWHNLKWMYDGHDILRMITKKFDTKNIYLATMPMPNLESALGKMMWINDNLPVYLERTIITTRNVPKALLARPDILLVDDKDENIDEFIEAGGRGLLVPRPWNRAHLCSNDTLAVVKTFLEGLT